MENPDKEIIKELQIIFSKMKINTLEDILKKYKPDDEKSKESIRDLLLSFNIGFEGKIEEDEEKPQWKWIEILGNMYPVQLIQEVRREPKLYNFVKNKLVYTLSLNPTIETKNSIIRNVIFAFDNEVDRDRLYDDLKLKLQTNYNVVFI